MSMFAQLADVLENDPRVKARPEQLPPAGDWSIWLYLAGRGAGKTWSGGQWVLSLAQADPKARIALIAPTAADARDVMIEGASGVLNIAPDHFRPSYEPSKRRLTFPNGALATLYSSEEPERLRGPQHSAIWADELCAWSNDQQTWDMAMFGLRLGRNPRVMVSTTPKPTRLLKDLVSRAGQDVVITKGSTFDNRENLAPAFFSQIIRKYEGTRLGRQELNAELLMDMPGALWSHDAIDSTRVKQAPDLCRIVVAIDPAVSTSENSDETGIVVAGVDRQQHAYILADLSGKFQPHQWARVAVNAFHTHRADRIIAEKNQGGAMVEQTLRAVGGYVPIRLVHASRGKVTRAEPVSALYEQKRVHHVGVFSALEDQMTSFTSDFDRSRQGSPDRVDALVWALTELLPGSGRPARFIPAWHMAR